MASVINFAVLAVFALTLPSIAVAVQHVVGDDSGWTNDFNYTAWAAGRVFRVGDTLLFKYTPPNHNVFKVDQAGFQGCIKPASNPTFTSGNDVVPLTAPGKKWYICGVNDHCATFQQKLAITVLDAAAPSPTSPSAPAPTSPAFSVKPSSFVIFAAVAAAATALAAV